MPSRLKLRHALLVSVIGLILIFQNCAQVDPSASEGEVSSYQSKLPHAFIPQIDTISHMSCSQMNDPAIEKRAYYTFRALAYSPITGGLKLTTEFRQATQYYNNTERARAFAESELNSNSLLSFSIRQSTNYQTPWKEGNFLVGEEIESFLPTLDSAQIGGPLAASADGQMINYFPGSGSKRLMEASLRFYNFENVVKLTRDNLDSRASLLVAGFSDSSDEAETALRGPAGIAADKAYGKGYRLRFSLPVGYTSGERRIISSNGGVEEVDLQTGSVQAANWDCSATYQFMVIRPEDKAAGRVICNATVDTFSNATEQASLNAIRRVLRVEDWYIDVARRCIIPKRTGDYCYGPLAQGMVVQYGSATCANTGTTMCPHFVSVCIRK